MTIKEIKAKDLNTKEFIRAQAGEIARQVGNGYDINALSGGVDSSAVTMLGHLALGERLKTCFVDNGIMRKSEPEGIVRIFKKLGVNVEVINAQSKFFSALKGLTDPEEKREAVTQTFYKDVFGRLVTRSKAQFLGANVVAGRAPYERGVFVEDTRMNLLGAGV